MRSFRHHLCARLHDPGSWGYAGRGPKMFDAGALRYVVLQLIAERPRHGYDIIKEIEQHVGGGYAPSPGAIYPLLALLEDLGYVVVTPDGNKKLHKITPDGRAFLKENRAFVDAIFARMAGSSEERGRYDLRRAMYDIKTALMERADGWSLSDEQVRKIQTILERAASDIRKLP